MAAVPELVSTILGRICWLEAGGFQRFFSSPKNQLNSTQLQSGRAFSKTKVGSCPSSSCIAFASPKKARRVRAGSNFGMRLYSQGWPHPNPCTDECTERGSGLFVEHGMVMRFPPKLPRSTGKVTLATQVLQVRAWAHALSCSTEFSVLPCFMSTGC